MKDKKSRYEVWAQICVSDVDSKRIREFFVARAGIAPKFVPRQFHVTVYHSRRPMRGVEPTEAPMSLSLPVAQTRFMVLAPGGENPRPDLIPSLHAVGIRIGRQNPALPDVLAFRNRLLRFETPRVLGSRLPSTRSRSAFGARAFQPHISLIRPGSGIDSDLRPMGVEFRSAFESIIFDRFLIKVVSK